MPPKILPPFWLPHKVKAGETLSAIAHHYHYNNPGPIVVFSCDHLPGAIAKWGARRQFTMQSTRKKRAIYLDGRPKYEFRYAPLRSNQINSMAIFWNHAGLKYGDVLTIVDSFPINKPIDTRITPFLEIPWPSEAIGEFISVQQSLRADIIHDTHLLVNEGKRDLAQLKEVLLLVDVMASVFTGFRDAVKFGYKGAKSAATFKDLYKEAGKFMVKKAINAGSLMYKGATSGPVVKAPTLTLPKKIKLKKGFGFWLDNTVGWLSPSKWTATFAAVAEGDAGIAWWGEEAIDAKTQNRIIDHAQKRIDWIDMQRRFANQARSRSFHRHRVEDSAA